MFNSEKEYTSESDNGSLSQDLYIADILKDRYKKNKIFYINSFSVTTDDDCSSSENSLVGGYKMDIVKTFINKIRNNPKFKKNFKNYSLSEIKPSSSGDIIMATIIDLNHIKKNLSKDKVTEEDMYKYVTKGDFIPLIYGNTDNKNIIYLKQISNKGKKKIVRKKKTVFSENNRPVVFFFKVSNKLKFYNLVKKEKEDDDITSIDNKAVVEYVIGRYFVLIPNPHDNLKIKNIECIIYKNGNFDLKQFKQDITYDFQKMTIEEFENILDVIIKRCTKFS